MHHQHHTSLLKYEKNKPHGNGNGQIWARTEKRKMRHFGRMGNVKKVQNHEYHVPEETWYSLFFSFFTLPILTRCHLFRFSEESRENPKRCNEERNLQYPNKQARHHHRRNCHQRSQCTQTGYDQHQTGRRGVKENIDIQGATESSWHTNRIKKSNSNSN